MYIERHVRLIRGSSKQPTREPSADNFWPLSALRSASAWVLLADSGAGKTTAFKHEAQETSGYYTTVAQFLHEPIELIASHLGTVNPSETTPGSTSNLSCLFIDALDEYRDNHGWQALLTEIAAKLKRLGNPTFRVACRATDWWQSSMSGTAVRNRNFGETILVKASPDGTLSCYQLEPLSGTESERLLTTAGVEDSDELIASLQTKDLESLLTNPTNLELIAEIWHRDRASLMAMIANTMNRQGLYEMACKLLVQETNNVRQSLQLSSIDNPASTSLPSGRIHSTEQWLDMAGYLCAVLLISDRAGINLTPNVVARIMPNKVPADHRDTSGHDLFADLEQMQPEDLPLAHQVLASRLFTSSASDTATKPTTNPSTNTGAQLLASEHAQPAHRSIAEFLAANWISKTLNQQGHVRLRVLNLLTGFDGQALTHLRGVYGWLAQLNAPLHNTLARQLITGDPVCVLLHADVADMTVPSKRMLLAALRDQALANPAAFWGWNWHLNLSTHVATRASTIQTRIAGLFEPSLLAGIVESLHISMQSHSPAPQQNEGHQTWIMFLLKVLAQHDLTHTPDELRDTLRSIIIDPSRWQISRQIALDAWLDACPDADRALMAHSLLVELNEPGELTTEDGLSVTSATSGPNLDLTGLLLRELYPGTISSADILDFCVVPVQSHGGLYQAFWTHWFANQIPDDDLPLVVDQLVGRTDLHPQQWDTFGLDQMLAKILTRALTLYSDNISDNISDERLYDWLQLGSNSHGGGWNPPRCQQVVTSWLSKTPLRYKGLLHVAFMRSRSAALANCADVADKTSAMTFTQSLFYNSRFLQSVAPPDDLGQWHLDQVVRCINGNVVQHRDQPPGVSQEVSQKANQEMSRKVTQDMIHEHLAQAALHSLRLSTHHCDDQAQTQRAFLARLEELRQHHQLVHDLASGPLQRLLETLRPTDGSSSNSYDQPASHTPYDRTRTPSRALTVREAGPTPLAQDSKSAPQGASGGESANRGMDTQLMRRAARTRELVKHWNAVVTAQVNPMLLNQLARLWTNELPEFANNNRRSRFAQYCDNPDELMTATESALIACTERQELPSVEQIIDMDLKRRQFAIGKACLTGMSLRYRRALTPSSQPALSNLSNLPELADLPDSTLASLACWQIIAGLHGLPEWFVWLLANKPDLVSDVFSQYLIAKFKHRDEQIQGIEGLVSDRRFAAIATTVIPIALKAFPVRHKSGQLTALRQLIRGAIEYCPTELLSITQKKLTLKSVLPIQRVSWLVAATLLDPAKYEQSLWAFVGENWERADEIAAMLEHDPSLLTEPSPLASLQTPVTNVSSQTIGRVIELLLPRADVRFEGEPGMVTPAMQRGLQIRALMTHLGSLGTSASVQELDRLAQLQSTSAIHADVLMAKQRAMTLLRDQSSTKDSTGEAGQMGQKDHTGSLSAVVHALRQSSPTSARDLQLLVLDLLDEVQGEIKHGSNNTHKLFWQSPQSKVSKPVSDHSQPVAHHTHKPENECRDVLLNLLSPRLHALGLTASREHVYRDDKRVDIQVSKGNDFSIPIEIKGAWHRELWTAAHTQLKRRYNDPRQSDGYGIYLVLWVGADEVVRVPARLATPLTTRFAQGTTTTSALPAITPNELERLLQADLDQGVEVCLDADNSLRELTDNRNCVMVRVLDLT